MSQIFEHIDPSGDALAAFTHTPAIRQREGLVSIWSSSGVEEVVVYLDPVAVQSLRDALTEWLEGATTVAADQDNEAPSEDKWAQVGEDLADLNRRMAEAEKALARAEAVKEHVDRVTPPATRPPMVQTGPCNSRRPLDPDVRCWRPKGHADMHHESAGQIWPRIDDIGNEVPSEDRRAQVGKNLAELNHRMAEAENIVFQHTDSYDDTVDLVRREHMRTQPWRLSLPTSKVVYLDRAAMVRLHTAIGNELSANPQVVTEQTLAASYLCNTRHPRLINVRCYLRAGHSNTYHEGENHVWLEGQS